MCADDYVSYDEFDDTIGSIAALETHLTEFENHDAAWKWVVLFTHSALQGACVCYLTRTDGSGALTKDSEKALRRYHNLSSQKAMCEANKVRWILEEP